MVQDRAERTTAVVQTLHYRLHWTAPHYTAVAAAARTGHNVPGMAGWGVSRSSGLPIRANQINQQLAQIELVMSSPTLMLTILIR